MQGVVHVFTADMLEVYVLTFADEPFAQVLSATIDSAGVTIGRSSECVLHLPDPERHISRVQAKLETDASGRLRVSNVSSANSIFVGDREISPGNAFEFAENDELRVGLFTLAVREVRRPPVDVFSVSLAQAPLKREPQPIAATAAPVISVASAVVGEPSQPASSSKNPVEQQASDPFLDLFPSAPGVKVLDATPPPALGASALASVKQADRFNAPPTSTQTQIPDDFDPFAMPSAASRNTGDPFSEIKHNKNVSLRGLLDDSSSAHRLIDETPMKGSAPDFDPLLGAATTGGGAGDVLDPLALFGARAGVTGFDDIVPAKPYGTILDRPPSELNALTKFAQPKGTSAPSQPAPSARPLLDPLAAFGGDSATPPDFGLIAEISPTQKPEKEIKAAVRAIEAKVEPLPLLEKTPAPTQAPEKPKVSATSTQVTASRSSTHAPIASSTRHDKKSVSPAVDNEHLLQALLDGIGIPSLELQGGLDEAMMRKIGEILRVSFDGTVEMMIARAMTKREVRTDVTMILAEKNNPIKFAPDGRAAIMQLLGKPFPGFMTHEDAIRDAYEDLRAHEVGVLAGMRAALKAVLNRFDPASLEKKITSKSSLESVLPHLRKAKLWDLYTEMSSQILTEAEDEFQSLFGKAFREVYEAEVEKVRQGRSRA